MFGDQDERPNKCFEEFIAAMDTKLCFTQRAGGLCDDELIPLVEHRTGNEIFDRSSAQRGLIHRPDADQVINAGEPVTHIKAKIGLTLEPVRAPADGIKMQGNNALQVSIRAGRSQSAG